MADMRTHIYAAAQISWGYTEYISASRGLAPHHIYTLFNGYGDGYGWGRLESEGARRRVIVGGELDRGLKDPTSRKHTFQSKAYEDTPT